MNTNTDKLAQALPCPHCGADPVCHAIEPHSHAITFGDFKMPDHEGSYVIECPACDAGMIGGDQASVTARWNRRATLPQHSAEQAGADGRVLWQAFLKTQEAKQAEQQAGPVATVTRFHDLGGEFDWTGRVICPVGTKLYAHPAPSLTDADIREVFLAHGFTIKEGQTDLKPYVFAAARALLARAEATPSQELDKVDAERYRAIRTGKLSYTVKCEKAAFYCGGHAMQPGAKGYPEAFDAAVDAAMDEDAARAAGKEQP